MSKKPEVGMTVVRIVALSLAALMLAGAITTLIYYLSLGA